MRQSPWTTPPPLDHFRPTFRHEQPCVVPREVEHLSDFISREIDTIDHIREFPRQANHHHYLIGKQTNCHAAVSGGQACPTHSHRIGLKTRDESRPCRRSCAVTGENLGSTVAITPAYPHRSLCWYELDIQSRVAIDPRIS